MAYRVSLAPPWSFGNRRLRRHAVIHNPLRRSHSSAHNPPGLQPHPLFRYLARPNPPWYRYLQTVRRRGALASSFLLSTHCLMLSQCGSSAPSLAARPYSYPSPLAHPPLYLYPRPELYRTSALGCCESSSSTPSACRGDALCTGSFSWVFHKARLFPSCGPSA
jgi:hypothetical protein